MNAGALAQYSKNQRRLAKVHQGRAMPRLRHLSHRFYSPGGFFRIMPDPRPVSPLELTQHFMRMMSLIKAIPFLGRRDKKWRK